jgi:hypothetical protein
MSRRVGRDRALRRSQLDEERVVVVRGAAARWIDAASAGVT